MKTLIKNIKEIVGIANQKTEKIKKGKEMDQLSVIQDGWLIVEDDMIIDFGNMRDWQGVEDWNNINIIDANQGIVLPTWCDSHTHIVYTGTRELEFVDRINGLSYEDIAKNGGGILNSAKLLSQTSKDQIYKESAQRLDQLIRLGTGSIEIKSGYGLNIKDEIKMLQIIRQLSENFPIPIKSTFLGAHAVPKNTTQEKYTQTIIEEMIPEVAKQKLAEYIDVFCDTGFFTQKETEKILAAGLKHGLKGKIHANELGFSGGVEVGVKMEALSVDHLEYISETQIHLLKQSKTIPTLLPGTAYFLGFQYPPARLMIDSGLPIAVASDFNPGSCPSGNMSIISSLCCTQMKMTPQEALNAITINGAYAMETDKIVGSIKKGKRANLIITKPISSINYIPYAIGENIINKVIINGKIYHDSETN